MFIFRQTNLDGCILFVCYIRVFMFVLVIVRQGVRVIVCVRLFVWVCSRVSVSVCSCPFTCVCVYEDPAMVVWLVAGL